MPFQFGYSSLIQVGIFCLQLIGARKFDKWLFILSNSLILALDKLFITQCITDTVDSTSVYNKLLNRF